MTRTLKLTIAYDGTDYAGWQIQKSSTQQTAHNPAPRRVQGHEPSVVHGRQKPTIQGTIERALRRILQESVRVVGSGRTDAGVHALAQAAHVRTSSAMPCERLQGALNAWLPPDIVVTRIEEVPPAFHARFDAKVKRYRYRMVNGPVVLPFERRYVHQVRVPLKVSWMRREAAALRGRHDFRAFHQTGRLVHDTRRVVSDIQVRRRGSELVIEIEASGFLYTMVRSIVGTLIDIGRGHRRPGTIASMLKTTDRRLAGPTAPPQGLCLIQVTY